LNTLEEILQEGFASLGLSLPEEACARYRTYYTLLEEKNRVMNLTGITGEENVARLHFLDCAALLRYTGFAGKSVYDIGTGAGFPGLALKIACPEMNLTLLDSLDKRIGFLKEVCSALGFEDTPCLHARAEEAAKDHREKADIVTSRAVAGLNVLSELCLPFVKEGGLFLAMKGPDFEQELDEARPAIRRLGGKVETCEVYTVPGTEIRHSVILIWKVGKTPAAYPRRWAQIKKAPIR
jgi:16S rRNA (guanine527-N7)-methyltransferase